jgi:nitrite reductase/ring-hydroxylating ferredoxin subunit
MTWHPALSSKRLKNGKKKMLTVKGKLLMFARHEGEVFATEALCRHMRWPLAYGGKLQNGCIRCPLHQTTHHLDDGSLVEWSPFPLFPPYGRLVGKFSKEKPLKVYEVREKDGFIEVNLT